jgi:hypothetical protein
MNFDVSNFFSMVLETSAATDVDAIEAQLFVRISGKTGERTVKGGHCGVWVMCKGDGVWVRSLGSSGRVCEMVCWCCGRGRRQGM